MYWPCSLSAVLLLGESFRVRRRIGSAAPPRESNCFSVGTRLSIAAIIASKDLRIFRIGPLIELLGRFGILCLLRVEAYVRRDLLKTGSIRWAAPEISRI